MSSFFNQIQEELEALKSKRNYRSLPRLVHEGREVSVNGHRMLNLSSNDYLGLANRLDLREAFLHTLNPETFLPSASSSRSLTGNFLIYEQTEKQLTQLFGAESALLFNCGYHANSGILPAVCTPKTLILADKLVHASLIDGIRLAAGKCIRFRHNDVKQLSRLVEQYHADYEYLIIVTESVFSMDGDKADLKALVALKRTYPNVLLYVDEAHAFGIFGPNGLGCAEEEGCIADIDFLVGTFGKALASAGAYLICRKVVREYLINRMRTFIFTTALPPVNVAWTSFLLDRLSEFGEERQRLLGYSRQLRTTLTELGYNCPSVSQIVPMTIGTSQDAILKAEMLQRKGFYALPVRPPTVPEGTSRIRFSLTADLRPEEMEALLLALREGNEPQETKET